MQSQIYEYLSANKALEQLIVNDDTEALNAGFIASIKNIKPFILPDIRAFFNDDLRAFREELFDFLSTLNDYYNYKQKKLLITPFKTALLPFPNASILGKIELTFAQEIDHQKLKNQLYHWGYSFSDLVEVRGEVSFRGDIIDIFPINSEMPYRLSCFDNEIDSIKTYDPSTQKTQGDELEEMAIIPAFFGLTEEQFNALNQKIQDRDFDDDDHAIDVLDNTIDSLGLWFLDELSFFSSKAYESAFIDAQLQALVQETFEIEEIPHCIDKAILSNLPIIPQAKAFQDLPPIKDYRTLIAFHKEKNIKLIASQDALLRQYDLEDMTANFKLIYSDEIVNISSKDELIISLNKPKPKRKKRPVSNIIVDELKVNDFVVHHTHGIGIFRGIESTKVLGVYKDFVALSYQNEDKLLIPVDNLEVIDRYFIDSGSAPVLDRLGKGSFVKLKDKVKNKLLQIADKIVSLAAQRELIKGIPIPIDIPIIDTFQKQSGFDYTKDQKQSVQEIFDELNGAKIMDRLLIGDVGFGKTEVAMNAILATILQGHQVIFVVPTTLLSNQHYHSIKERFEGFNISMAKVDRFVKAKEKREIFEAFQKGQMQLLIGTHALFSIERPKHLALVIIDEEHKFGVKQKEQLKSLAQNVHLLSMSATPIPRSLNLALSHIKTISYLNTPPKSRKPIRTYVKVYDEVLIKEIILRELRRKGQVFYIYNHIATIEQKKEQLLEILPHLKILIIHSKINTVEMEKGIIDFEGGDYDLLLSTCIVESGIHLPNVNSIIVDNSDRFGLADLHQLRGRVGRSDKEAFCYYLVEDKESVTMEAKKRLSALETHASLGSGALIARQDLEIRGAGNILGEVQSGHIEGVGYSLYVKMLEESIQELSHNSLPKNETLSDKKEIEIKLSVDKFISSDLIPEDRLRLDLYRRLSRCSSVKMVYAIQEEIHDRFGDVDEHTLLFLDIVIIKILSLEKGIKKITNYEKNITIFFDDGNETKEQIQASSYNNRPIVDAILKFLKALQQPKALAKN